MRQRNVWKELLELSIVVPGLLLSILWGAYIIQEKNYGEVKEK